MATPSEIITMINTDLPTNGNNLITASVLRPVLTAMVNQINDLVGNASGLPSGSNNVIEALNNSTSSGITILTGTTDPNLTPPSSFDLGDFYTQTSAGVIIGFWQYNGMLWSDILSRQQQKIRNYKAVTGSYTILANDDVIVYNGTNINDLITLPNVASNVGRVLTIANISEYEINVSLYLDIKFSVLEDLVEQSSITIISNGTFWQQINNKI